MLKKACMWLTLMLAVLAVGYAQSSQTGSLIGTVTAEDGTTIPGVTVTAASSAIVIGKLTTVTNENGIFRFTNLAPGVYEITFQLEGFRTVIRKDVRVNAMQTYTINVGLRQEAIQEAIVVTGKGPTVDTQRQTRAANWDTEFLKSLPAARQLNNFVNMSPGMIGLSAHGGATMDNSVNLDGVNVIDPATGVQNVTFGLDIMDEISVQTGGLSAEYGSVRGAMVNVVTKSGGNKFSGTGSFYFNHESLQGDNKKGTVLEGQSYSGVARELEPALSIGGPIIKDKLWFFLSGSYNISEVYTEGFPYNNPQGKFAIKTKIPMPFGKLTFQPNQQNKFVFSLNYNDRLLDHRFADRYHTLNNTVKQTTPTKTINAQWTRYFGNNLYANFKLGFVDFAMKLDSNSVKPVYYQYLTFQYLDNGGAWRTNDHYIRKRYNANVDATTFIDNFMGTHELKVGGEAQIGRTSWLVYGESDPVTGAHWNTFYGPYWWYGLVLYNGGFDRKDNMDDYFMFLQDTWRVNRHLTLNLGLRLEYNSIVWPKQGNPGEGDITLPGALSNRTFNRTITSNMKVMDWLTLAPRVGLIYDLFGDSKTLLKASWSRYTMPNQVGWVNVAHKNGWVGYFTMLDPITGEPQVGSEWMWASPSTTQVDYTAADGTEYKLKAPYVDELTLGAERELFTDWSASVRYLRKWDRRLIHAIDAKKLDADKLMATGELDWSKAYTTKTAVDPYDNKTVTFYNRLVSATELHIVNPPGAERNYEGVEITLNKRFAKGWALNTSYVYGKGTGLIDQGRTGGSLGTSNLFADPNAHINAYGVLDLDARHQFKVQGLLKGPLGINISGYYRYLSGGVWARTVSSSRLGVSLNQTAVTIWAEARGSRRLPPTSQLDLRLEKAFKIGGLTLSAFADCFNVLNRGVATSVWANSSNPTWPFERMMTINNPRLFQLGARFEF